MYQFFKKILFSRDPEKAHNFAMKNLNRVASTKAGAFLLRQNFDKSCEKEVELWNLKFKNPIGLAAGFDKDAKYLDALENLGFGFVEIGTLTPTPQPGNQKPRLFRLIENEAIINRMGFNNEGVDAAVERLKNRKCQMIIGGNIGKNKSTPNEKAVEDYEYCFRKLYNYVDYFVVNVSSPNTPNLRDLQQKEPLSKILSRLQLVNTELGLAKPLLLKISPDIDVNLLDEMIETMINLNLDGIVATNTSINRQNLSNEKNTDEAGGLSGKPLKDRSTELIQYIHQKTQGKLPIIGVGGIFDAHDAKEKLDAGASLVQVYTGFIYEGPGIVKNICKGI
ncbi:MAG: quinone-dependent dihydroorotate dehydrogenase [Flavobacteriaceae bacterium]|nr:quinone-dependent dihydroorotate dehydrogenase [Flavobacteriaceae bacterium]